MTLSKPIIFTAGLIIGAGSGVLATWQYFKQKYEKQASEEIQEALDYIRESSDYRANTINDDDAEINTLTPEERKERLLENERKTTNYASMYKNKQDPDPAIQADFRQAEDLAEVESDDETPEEQANKEHQENRNKPPRIISLEEYENLPAYISRETLYYYHYDEIVADDNEEEIPDPETYIGDALDKYNFRENEDEQIIFVLNPRLDKAYEIQRVMGAFTDGNGF